MKKPELLAPAGSFEKAKIAFMYGADAVYCGTASLSLRSRAEVDDNDLEKTIKYAHSIGKKVYAAINIYAWDSNYEEIEKQVKMLDAVHVDAIIASDGGVIQKIKEIAPNIEIHVSTQANVVSYHAAKFWHDNGASRVILGRETSKDQIKEIMKNKPENLEVEMFIHGALCWAYSGRCFLSEYLSCRSANLGDCSQSCRWAYNMYLEEKNKPGNLMPVETDENGTYILSSKDLCLIKEIPQIVEMGVDSLKIEGRLKTEYYLASVVNVYRNAIDDYIANPNGYDYTKYLKELEKVNDKFEFPVHWGTDIQTEHERYLSEVVFKRPVFVTDYPAEIKAFYMKQNPDGKTVAAADLLVAGIGEIIGGSQREDDFDKLLARMKQLNLSEQDYWWYLDLRRYGSCPHAGFGLGFERMMMYLTGIQNIRDVLPFPRTPNNCEF